MRATRPSLPFQTEGAGDRESTGAALPLAIGRPLLRFFDLRTEVRRTTILYDNVHARWTQRDNVRVLASSDEDATPNNLERLQEAEHQYRDLASQVRAFADTQSPTCVILRWLGYDIRKAAASLIGLSNTVNSYGKTRAFHKQTIDEALRFLDQ